MSVKTDAARRSLLPEGMHPESVSIRESYKDFLTRLSVYDTIGLDISDDMKIMISKKKEREILDYISTFHHHAVSKVAAPAGSPDSGGPLLVRDVKAL